MADAIDKVEASTDKPKAFKNFITAFEAIVAYHKSAEKK
jgi:CRISPR type III-A-associated protein Csm2